MGGISADFRWCHATFDFVYGSINKAVAVMQTFILSLFIVVNVLWFSYYLSMGSCSTNKDIIFWLSSFTCQHWNWEKSANRKESIIWRKKISLIFRFNQVKISYADKIISTMTLPFVPLEQFTDVSSPSFVAIGRPLDSISSSKSIIGM